MDPRALIDTILLSVSTDGDLPVATREQVGVYNEWIAAGGFPAMVMAWSQVRKEYVSAEVLNLTLHGFRGRFYSRGQIWNAWCPYNRIEAAELQRA